ncbi:MAG: hypothetical protein ACRDZQ_10280 [Acidimicrobiales bacterium]
MESAPAQAATARARALESGVTWATTAGDTGRATAAPTSSTTCPIQGW